MPKSKASATMNYSVPVQVRRPKLDLLPSIAYLDIPKLAGAENAEVELGSFHAGCCRRQVLAVIRNGKVTGFRVEGCSTATPPSPEIARLLKAARKQLSGSNPPAKFRPVPVADFFRGLGDTGTGIEIWFCIEICVFGRCLLCCLGDGGTGCATFDDPS